MLPSEQVLWTIQQQNILQKTTMVCERLTHNFWDWENNGMDDILEKLAQSEMFWIQILDTMTTKAFNDNFSLK